MKAIGEFIKATFVGGIMVILPLAFVALLLMRIVDMLLPMAMQIAGWLPHRLHYPGVIVSLIVILICFAAGLLMQTLAGQRIDSFFERNIFSRIPGYSMLRSFTRRIGNVEDSEKFAPALVEVEGALAPAFVVEDHADGRRTVFVPSAPTPGVGTIYIMAKERVHLVDIPFLKSVQCITSWGVGSTELLKAMRPPEAEKL